MKILRVFMKPTAERWGDFPIPEQATVLTVWPQIVAEGVIARDVLMIPRDQIHHMLVLEVPDQSTTFTVFPGGKPN